MQPEQLDPKLLTILIILTLIDLIMKGFGLWIAAGNKQRGWFISILIFNTLGILPALYLIYFQKGLRAKGHRTENED